MVFSLSWLMPSNGWIQLYESVRLRDMKRYNLRVRNNGFSGVNVGTGGM
jgi:hypothetical protein